MKKRIFTLFALAMLIGGVSSTLKAQVNPDTIYFGKGNVSIFTTPGEVYETGQTSMLIHVSGSNLKDTTITLSYTGAAAYLGLPTTITLKKASAATDSTYIIPIDENWSMPNDVNGTTGSVSIIGKSVTDSYTFYNAPKFTVNYVARTAQYAGILEVSVTGGNPDKTTRKLSKGDGNNYYYLTTDDVLEPFSDTEVASLTYGDKIKVTAPWGGEYTLDIPGIEDEVAPGTLLRPVTIPVVFDAALSREPGVHQTPSAEDFTFTIKPTGSNVGKVPTVSTGRTDLPDSEGVTYAKLSDGSYLVTIVRVQSPINLTIDFATGNAAVENNSVWSNGNLLYMSTATSGVANIYSITGALVNTVALTAGETANVSLPTGFYVVTVNGKAYKVTVK